MEFDLIIKLLKEKISALGESVKKDQDKIKELSSLAEIIRKIKDNPYILYKDEGKIFIDALGFSEEEKKSLQKWRTIYEASLLYGKKAVPQIEEVEKGTKQIVEQLLEKICMLDDVIARRNLSSLLLDGYKKLTDEVLNEDSFITEIDILIELLNDSKLTEEEKNKVKLVVNDRNVRVFNQRKQFQEESIEKAEDVEEVSVGLEEEVLQEPLIEDNEYSRERKKIESELESKFGKKTLNSLKSVLDLFSSYESLEEIQKLLSEWEFSLGVSYIEIIDALIMIKKIDMLVCQEVLMDQEVILESDREEIEKIQSEISLLEEHKSIILKVKKIEEESIEVDVSESMSEIDKYLSEYSSDPKSTPKCLLFLNSGVGKDISKIKNESTLRDVFLLIERFRRGEIQPINIVRYEGIRELKLSNRSQARVMIVHLDENVYGVVNVLCKKTTRDSYSAGVWGVREKEANILVKSYKEKPEFAARLIESTSELMDQLVERVKKGNRK